METEALERVKNTNVRFENPVRVRIFAYGFASETEISHGVEGLDPPVDREEITFPGLSLDLCPRPIQRQVAKLHLQMAHCGRADLIRTMANYGASASALSAANHLKCESCEKD